MINLNGASKNLSVMKRFFIIQRIVTVMSNTLDEENIIGWNGIAVVGISNKNLKLFCQFAFKYGYD